MHIDCPSHTQVVRRMHSDRISQFCRMLAGVSWLGMTAHSSLRSAAARKVVLTPQQRANTLNHMVWRTAS